MQKYSHVNVGQSDFPSYKDIDLLGSKSAELFKMI